MVHDSKAKSLRGRGEDDVINIDEKIGCVWTMSKNEERIVTFALNKANCRDKVCKSLVPGPWCLLESIEGLFEPANVVRKLWVSKTHWLVHVNSFEKIPM